MNAVPVFALSCKFRNFTLLPVHFSFATKPDKIYFDTTSSGASHYYIKDYYVCTSTSSGIFQHIIWLYFGLRFRFDFVSGPLVTVLAINLSHMPIVRARYC
jgi:hypothetical protein